MAKPRQQPAETVQADWLKPFASILILRCLASNPAPAVEQLLTFLHERVTGNRRSETIIVASGFGEGTTLSLQQDDDAARVDQLLGFVYQRSSVPGWAQVDAPYRDMTNELVIILRRSGLVAVHAPQALRDNVLRWLDKDPPPPFRRVSPAILQGAFLQGAARGMWLNGTHVRRATKPDSKNISGTKLEDALNPFEDSTFALRSARAAAPEDPSLTALNGVVGTTPRDALMWNRATRSLADFIAVVREALVLVEQITAANTGVDRPYPLLAAEVDDLTAVTGAYDLSVLAPDDLPPGPDTTEDVLEAAELLQRALLNITGDPTSPHFRIDVGFDGAIGGRLRCNVTRLGGRVRLHVGLDGQPSDDESTRKIRDALFYEELLTIYYHSGHSIQHGAIYLPEIREMPFPNWDWADFTGFDISKEKPARTPADIHRDVGTASDNSLFGWVAKHYALGSLTCDDGPGEVADFVHLAPNETLSLIHVKAAITDSPARQIAGTAYEVVVSQASKNVGFLQHPTLAARLSDPTNAGRATWKGGVRQADRQGFLAALAARSPTAPLRVIIVQPHVAKRRYDQLYGAGESAANADDLARMHRLEYLLNSARGSITGVGADLFVVGSA